MITLRKMRQPNLFLSLKRDLSLVSFLAELSFIILGHLPYLTMRSSVVFVQCIQEVFIAEEWVKEARNEVKVEANLCSKVDKALGTSEQQVQALLKTNC